MTDQATAAEPARPASPLRRLKTAGGQILIFVLLGLAIFRFPFFPAADLDPSWRMTLHYALQHHLQFGRDLVFTYGPLGFILGRTFSGADFWPLVIWQFLLTAGFALTIMRFARPLSWTNRLFYYLFFILFIGIYLDLMHVAVITLLALLVIHEARKNRNSLPLIAGLFMAVLAAVKFTNFLMAIICVVVAVAYDWFGGRRRRALVTAGAFFGGYLVVLLLCHQNPLLQFEYLRNSWSISQGYEQTMFLDEPAAMFHAGLATLLLLAVYGALFLAGLRDRSQGIAVGLIFAAGTYLNWKHGFVRADGHVLGFYLWALLPVAAFPALLGDGERFRLAKRAVLALTAASALWGIYLIFPPCVSQCLELYNSQVRDVLPKFAHLSATEAAYRQSWTAAVANSRLPDTRDEVGAARVDVLGFEQGAALLNGLNFAPRPVFQSYSAYTPRLIRLNRDYYLGPRAPAYALFKFQTIDNRFPTMDDSETLRALWDRYTCVFDEGGFYLWKRDPAAAKIPWQPPVTARTGRAALGAAVSLGDLQGKNVWLTLDWRPSLLGHLRSFFYKPPLVQLAVTDSTGQTRAYRLPQPEAAAGFLLSPLLTDQSQFLLYCTGGQPPAVRSFAVEVDPAQARYVSGVVRYRLATIPPPAEIAQNLAAIHGRHYRMFKTAPDRIQAYAEPAEVEFDGVRGLQVHAPSEIVYDLPAGASALRGKFALNPGSYANGNRTVGAVFSVIFVAHGASTVLFTHRLDPLNDPADRGWHPFQVDLRGHGPGKLLLKIDPAPNPDHSNAWDWTCWSGLEIK